MVARMRQRLFKPTPKIRVNQRELAYGIKVEMEHTNSRRIARIIAMQHLNESPLYYTFLRRAEKAMPPRKQGIKSELCSM